MGKKVVLLCSDCFSTVALYNRINPAYPIDTVIIEQPFRGMALAKSRLKKIGFWKLGGQILFNLFIVRLLRIKSKARVKDIINSNQLDTTPLPTEKIRHVASVNDRECLDILLKEKPDLVIVNGTRIISKKILDNVQAVFINMHTGITPQYRGVHGGYWALVQNDPEHCGVTVHLVDKGIDTGGILYQQKINVTKTDNFVTYPYLQFASGVVLLQNAVRDFVTTEQLRPYKAEAANSKLWSHPTIWEYLYQRIFRGKK
jgi:folate-dependent phosphoribosylglycinamide formyltransferase PurN